MPARRRRPSASSTTPVSATRSVRCTTAPPPWTGWSRSRSEVSPSPRPPPPVLERQPDQHHRHPRTRRLHRRGGAQPARARRCRCRVRRQGRRRAAVRAGLATGRQVRRPAHLLRQQDGQDRRGLLLLRADHGGAPRRQRHPDPAADRLGGRLRGHRRPGRDERQGVARRDQARRDLRHHRDPRRPAGEGRRVPHQAARGRRRDRRGAAGEVLRRRGAHGRGDQGRASAS